MRKSMLVFIICLGSLCGMYHFNFKGAFFFLHVINPIAVLLYYLFVINEKRDGKIKLLFVTPVIVITYLVFDYCYGYIANHYVYGFFEPNELSVGNALVIGLVMYFILLIIGLVVYGLNRLINR